MQVLVFDDFAGRVGTVYRAAVPGREEQLLTLETANELPPSVRAEGSFRLEFRGPVDPILEQAIYPLRADDFECEMFIVPVGRDQRGTLYEAIFN